jgi:dienelactone hydrolase
VRRRCGALLAVAGSLVSALFLGGPSPAHADVSTDPLAPAGTWVRHIVPGLQAPDGTERAFYVRDPIGAGPGEKDAILLLHGLGLGGLKQAKIDGWDALADEKGLILIAGQGWHGSWAAGGCCGAAAGVQVGRTPHARVNDVSYVNDVIIEARNALSYEPMSIAPHGIAVVGFSNGGMLAADWACSRRDDVVAASVSGPLLRRSCAHAVHLLHVHGTKDTSVPAFGGFSYLTHTTIPDSRLEAKKIPRGSRYSLILLEMAHRWGPPGQAFALTRFISAWIDHQRDGSARAGA